MFETEKMSCIAERALSMAPIIEAVYIDFNFPYEMIGPDGYIKKPS